MLIADEAVSSLDVSVRAQILNLLSDLRSELGLTLIFISHDLSVVDHLCDRVAVMYLGRIAEIGPVADVLGRSAHPYTRALVAAVPQPVVGVRRSQPSLRGELPSPTNPPSGCGFRTRCPIVEFRLCRDRRRRTPCGTAISPPAISPPPLERYRPEGVDPPMTMPTAESRAILETLGLVPVINAAGFPSRLGGATLAPAVRAAMDAAAQNFIPIAEMQARASEIIAEATGAEAGLVASGGAACLTLAAAACITGDDPAAIDRLPDTTGLRNEIVMHRAHRNPFDHAIRVPGARLVEFGYLGVPAGVGAYRWQLDAAVTDKTAAVFYFGQPTAYVLPLAEVVEVAHARGVPVIVDAAGTMPPVGNLRRFIAEGADLVAFRWRQVCRGPAASGFLAGRRGLIRAATIQHQDAFVHPTSIELARAGGRPRGGATARLRPRAQGRARGDRRADGRAPGFRAARSRRGSAAGRRVGDDCRRSAHDQRKGRQHHHANRAVGARRHRLPGPR